MIGVNIAIIQDQRVLLTQREDFEVWCLPGMKWTNFQQGIFEMG
jgi:hypothetical protein